MATINPLFPSRDENDDKKSSGYMLPGKGKDIQPDPGRNAAADMIRQKLDKIYKEEPAAKKELQEINEEHVPLSKHQKFLSELQRNETSIAAIQTKWHEYYVALPEEEKHKVWQEFYAQQADHSRYAKFIAQEHGQVTHAPQPPKAHIQKDIATPAAAHKRLRDARSTREIKQSIRHKVSAGGNLKAKHHIQSLLFGLSVGALTLVILLFGLFNQMIIAPLIQPSSNVSATPIILGDDSLAADGQPKVVIPKINVEIPVDYNVASMDEHVIQDALNNGVIHYPSTVKPGEQGNAAFFGHSSNNIFNPGKYKFAFVLLNKLQAGDMFYLTYNGKAYAYKVYDKKIVNPDDMWVLNSVAGKTATATLITCDPPGTTLHRLVVWGEQISPDPATTTPGTPVQAPPANNSDELPGAPRSLWNRLTSWL